MQALAKRVAARGGAAVITESKPTDSTVARGPRNQPKRKGRK